MTVNRTCTSEDEYRFYDSLKNNQLQRLLCTFAHPRWCHPNRGPLYIATHVDVEPAPQLLEPDPLAALIAGGGGEVPEERDPLLIVASVVCRRTCGS